MPSVSLSLRGLYDQSVAGGSNCELPIQANTVGLTKQSAATAILLVDAVQRTHQCSSTRI